MTRTILVATDLSAGADRALARGYQLAAEKNARLVVLHVIDEQWPAKVISEVEAVVREQLEESVEALRRQHQETPSECVILVIPGESYAEIINVAQQQQADLIVMGMHRKAGLRDLLNGTTVARVMRKSGLPVLMVRQLARQPYRRALVPVDFSTCSRQALESVVALFPEMRFELVHAFHYPYAGFLHGEHSQQEWLQQSQQRLQDMLQTEMDYLRERYEAAPQLTGHLRQGAVLEVIRKQLEQSRPDLLVMGSHGRSGALHAMLGSVAESILQDPPCDVLVKSW